MKKFLIGKDMWSYIDGTYVKSTDKKDVNKYAEALKTLNKSNSKIITWINNSVSQSISMQLAKFDIAQEV